ncbi:hypothetical protein MNEG_2384 [Monoraphidium neglectum]|uniref:Condensin-2 complex subunit H2 C-terminal domain-containing protein n=1 Tax=Monoraphidium neglectum TaxID=145388 RepID=A0A0D2MZ40_9CHLO|nr:hypothetical protein MNEG_2384 [Monoraphidium neglectum]KIZ05577.1 hypothetical protein MNEG_2384 [Monoraphidium neglectum]|eukprot:XP_013904596.1 hypothetical protein MNEG_2384 [Monoraphidium neglectum]
MVAAGSAHLPNAVATPRPYPQGTTCVYSKKVEYLHNLVFRALETIHNKKQRERGGTDEEGGAKRGTRQATADDLDEAFLSLDEVALGQEAGLEDIDLDEDDEFGPRELLRPPTALLALEDAAAGQGETDAGSYRLAQCVVHESGALLLELRDGEAYDRQLRSRVGQPGRMAAAVAAAAAAACGAAAGLEGGAFGGGGDAYDGYDDDGGGDWGGGSDGEDDSGPIDMDDGLAAPQPAGGAGDDAALGGMADGPGDALVDDDGGADPGQAVLASASGGAAEQAAGVALRQRRGAGNDSAGQVAGVGQAFDPYKPLDPNDQGSLLIKPLQGRAVLDWSDVAEAEREEDAALGMGGADRAVGAQVDDDWGGDDGGWGDGGGDSEDGEPGAGGQDQGPSALQAALEEAAGGGMGPSGWLHGGGSGDVASGSHKSDSSRLSYEELCRAHIEKLIAAAAAQQVQSDLQVRVSTWRQRIDPVLSAEEDRSAFDIHTYGGTILKRLGGEDAAVAAPEEEEAVPFGRVVTCDNPFEVARMFAAMLQLVNNRNVELCRSDVENPSQPFGLQLLTTDRHHENMDERIGATAGPLTTQLASQLAAVAVGHSQQQPSGQAAKAAKLGRSGAKAKVTRTAAAAQPKGGGSGNDSGGKDASSSEGSDNENRGRRRQNNALTKGTAGSQKPAAKRLRQARVQAAA